jgi:hypothetical protein
MKAKRTYKFKDKNKSPNIEIIENIAGVQSFDGGLSLLLENGGFRKVFFDNGTHTQTVLVVGDKDKFKE